MAETIKTILTAETGNFHREFSKAQATISNYQKTVMKVAGVLGGSALLAGAVGRFNAIRNSIDALNDQAARLEMPVEEMQRLNAVATMSGASVETLAKALNKSKLNAIEAAGGSESLSNEFAALGLNAAEFLKLDPTERILALSRGFRNASDHGGAFSAVFKIMGKGAADLIPLLRDGEEGIAAISARLQVLGGADVAAIAKMNDELDLMASNIKTQVGGAFISLRPQIEGFIELLSRAADGLAVFTDPAGGIGRQGGVLGGADMLREMDKLQARIDEIKAKQKSGDTWSWSQGPLALNRELEKSTAAVETLKARFSGLGEESRIYAEQLREFERLRASGMGEGELAAQLNLMQGRTAEALKVLAAEKELTVAAGATAEEMEKQQKEMAKTAQSLAALQAKVGDRIIALQTPEKREEVARGQLKGILAGQGAGNVDELRQRVGTATNDADKAKALEALDAALDKLEEIKRVTAEIQSAAASAASSQQARVEKWQAQMDQEAADSAAQRLAAEEKAAKIGAARSEYRDEITALRLELSGRKALADSMREEAALRKEAAELSADLGISEGDALATARTRAGLIKDIAAQEEKAALRAQRNPQWKPRSEYKGIRRAALQDGDVNAGNNLKDWNSEWSMGKATRSNGRPIRSAEGSLKQDALRRRGQERENAALRNSNDPNTRQLQQLVEVTTALQEGLSRIGVIK